jgi:hypothetical protein
MCVVESELEEALVMGYKPILTFDTSSIGGTGCLVDEPDLDALLAGFTTGFHSRFTFTSVGEIIATTSRERRQEQLKVCKRLLSSGDCIDPQHEVIRKMVERFEQPGPFDWTNVDVRFLEAESEISREQNFSDELAEQEREEARTHEREFINVYGDAKPEFDKIFATGTKIPTSASELVSRLQTGGAFWTLAGNLCARVSRNSWDATKVRRFFDACPPFGALMVAIFVAQYYRCVRPQSTGPSLRTGRNDTFMATCLPYCEQFVTNDPKQLRCFNEVTSICRLPVVVRSYDDFRSGFLLPGTTVRSAA